MGANQIFGAEMIIISAYNFSKIGQVVSTPAVNDRPIAWYLWSDQVNLLVIMSVVPDSNLCLNLFNSYKSVYRRFRQVLAMMT